MFEAIGRPELQKDARFSTRADLNRNLPAFFDVVESALSTRNSAEWMEILEHADIPVMPMHTLESLLEDRHLQETRFFKVSEHPTEGKMLSMAIPSRWSKTKPGNSRHAPGIGEHSLEILQEAGYSREEAAALVESSVVYSTAKS